MIQHLIYLWLGIPKARPVQWNMLFCSILGGLVQRREVIKCWLDLSLGDGWAGEGGGGSVE